VLSDLATAAANYKYVRPFTLSLVCCRLVCLLCQTDCRSLRRFIIKKALAVIGQGTERSLLNNRTRPHIRALFLG
jgi:hypothetical protein